MLLGFGKAFVVPFTRMLILDLSYERICTFRLEMATKFYFGLIVGAPLKASSNFDSDWVRWGGSNDGKFSIKLASAFNSVSIRDGFNRGKVVWCGYAPPKVEAFIWLVVNGRAPVKLEFSKRGLRFVEALECICGNSQRCCFFIATLERYWRSEVVFNGKLVEMVQLRFIIKSQVAWWIKAKFHRCTLSIDDFIVDLVLANKFILSCDILGKNLRWEPPPARWLKFNVDGTSSTDELIGGIGGVLKNETGHLLLSFSLRVGSGPPVLHEVHDPASTPLRLEAWVRRLQRSWFLILFTPRAINVDDDSLAKLGLSSKEVFSCNVSDL
ncbi:hypothetical protein V6N11_064863 [Hibiscus sabdariffa]|uniref:Reverse transcriptase zinc-binding domain-containing protein n=2 Tax=Hibiscus sabdariffa TaxID=183260 RepID=A0ABR2CL29_9ROSI